MRGLPFLPWRWPAHPGPNAHALARQGETRALLVALARRPSRLWARDELGLTVLGSALSGWGGRCAPWAQRRPVVLALLGIPGALHLQGTDRRSPLALAPPDPGVLAALVDRLPVAQDSLHARAALGQLAHAHCLEDLAQMLAILQAGGVLDLAQAPAWALGGFRIPPLGAAYHDHPAQSLALLMNRLPAPAPDWVELVCSPRGLSARSLGALGKGLAQLPPACWHACPADAIAGIRERLAAQVPFLQAWAAPVDWMGRLLAGLENQRLAARLPVAPAGPAVSRL